MSRRSLRSKAIYPALVLALNCGLRDKELRQLQWGRIHLDDAFLVVGETKKRWNRRGIPLQLHSRRDQGPRVVVTEKFGGGSRNGTYSVREPQPTDPTKACTTFKTVWNKIRADPGIKGRWHDSRHTLITELAESGAGDQTIQDSRTGSGRC